MPLSQQPALGNPVLMTCFVDAHHAGDKMDHPGVADGLYIHLNNAPRINWF
jgi:hypothetical protein